MGWQAIDKVPIARALIGALVDDDAIPAFSGLIVDGQLGILADMLTAAVVDAAEYVWSYQRDRVLPLWTTTEVIARLGLPNDSNAPFANHVLAALASSRERMAQNKSPDDMADGIRRTLRLATSSQKHREGAAEELARKPTRKRNHRDAVIGALKRELRQRILATKSAVRCAEDNGKLVILPRLLRKDLAQAIGASRSSVTRAINESGDLELKILIETLEDEERIRQYAS